MQNGGFAERWGLESEKLMAQGVEKYEAYERVNAVLCFCSRLADEAL